MRRADAAGVCLERDPCLLSAARGLPLLGAHCVQEDEHTHARRLCLQPVAGARCGSLIHATPGICIQAGSASSRPPPLLFVLVLFRGGGGRRRVFRAPCAPRFRCTRVRACEPRRWESCFSFFFLFFSFSSSSRLIICVQQWMWSVPFQVMPGAT